MYKQQSVFQCLLVGFFVIVLSCYAPVQTGFGQETLEEYIDSTIDEQLTNDLSSEDQIVETTQAETTVEVDPTHIEYFKQIVPYTKFLNYQYVGMDSNFKLKDVIMEYMPDADGIFQVAEITDNQAVAFVYQIRPDGLYQLAVFDDYSQVEDLRYSEDASDEFISMILPVNLEIGSNFTSGYQQEIKKEITGVVDYVTIGEDIYREVLIIEEADDNQADTLRTYFAKEAGLVLVERVRPNGETTTVYFLNSKQGSLLN